MMSHEACRRGSAPSDASYAFSPPASLPLSLSGPPGTSSAASGGGLALASQVNRRRCATCALRCEAGSGGLWSRCSPQYAARPSNWARPYERAVAVFAAATIALSPAVGMLAAGAAESDGPSSGGGGPVDTRPATKVAGGAASTGAGSGNLRSVIKTVTRGVNLEGADFSGAQLEGVSFQQSILRQASFKGASIAAASFFDADLSGADISDADATGANFELANLRSVDATNAVLTGAYISGTTKFDGIKIAGSDWTDCFLRKDQQRYLCSRASGTNPTTGVDTRESLLCPPE